jgi:DnaJ domain
VDFAGERPTTGPFCPVCRILPDVIRRDFPGWSGLSFNVAGEVGPGRAGPIELPLAPVLDPYDVLGIAREATLEEAKAAYRRLAQLFHPDRLDDLPSAVQAEGTRRMREATDAIRAINARFGRPLRAPGHQRSQDNWSPDNWSPDNSEAKLYDAELESVDGPRFHARWSGQHAAAKLAAVQTAHRTKAATVRQVEWGTYEIVLSGSEMRHFLEGVIADKSARATLVAADPQLQARLSVSGPSAPVGLSAILTALEDRSHYSLVADPY